MKESVIPFHICGLGKLSDYLKIHNAPVLRSLLHISTHSYSPNTQYFFKCLTLNIFYWPDSAKSDEITDFIYDSAET